MGSTSSPARSTTTRRAPVRCPRSRASEIVWFDAFTTNVDRTPRNPNLLVWHGQTWLIDHGAALYQHHSDRDLVARAREAFPLIADHVLLPLASELPAADARLAAMLDAMRSRRPWLRCRMTGLARTRRLPARAYVDYLSARLAAPRGFVAEAEAARGA